MAAKYKQPQLRSVPDNSGSQISFGSRSSSIGGPDSTTKPHPGMYPTTSMVSTITDDDDGAISAVEEDDDELFSNDGMSPVPYTMGSSSAGSRPASAPASSTSLPVLSRIGSQLSRSTSRLPSPPSGIARSKLRLTRLYRDLVVPNMGVTLTLLSQLFNSLMILFCKLLLMDENFDEPLHPFQILFVRMSLTYIGCILYFTFYERNPDFPFGPKGYRGLMIARGLGGCAAVAGSYYALMYLTLSDTIVITFMAPTITSLMAWMFLGERFTRPEAIGGLIAFFGVLCISRPSFLFGEGTDSPTAGTESGDTSMKGGQGPSTLKGSSRELEVEDPKLRLLGSMLAFAGTFGTGVAMCAIRKIGFHAHAVLTVSFFALVTTVISFLGIVLTPGLSFQAPHTPKQWILMGMLGVTGFVMQFLLTAGMQREKAARAIAMSYSQLLYASLFDLLIFGHKPTPMSFLGEMIITCAVCGILYFKEDAPAGPRDVETNPNGSSSSARLPRYRDSNEIAAPVSLDDLDTHGRSKH